jgi:hypothetical protein
MNRCIIGQWRRSSVGKSSANGSDNPHSRRASC